MLSLQGAPFLMPLDRREVHQVSQRNISRGRQSAYGRKLVLAWRCFSTAGEDLGFGILGILPDPLTPLSKSTGPSTLNRRHTVYILGALHGVEDAVAFPSVMKFRCFNTI